MEEQPHTAARAGFREINLIQGRSNRRISPAYSVGSGGSRDDIGHQRPLSTRSRASSNGGSRTGLLDATERSDRRGSDYDLRRDGDVAPHRAPGSARSVGSTGRAVTNPIGSAAAEHTSQTSANPRQLLSAGSGTDRTVSFGPQSTHGDSSGPVSEPKPDRSIAPAALIAGGGVTRQGRAVNFNEDNMEFDRTQAAFFARYHPPAHKPIPPAEPEITEADLWTIPSAAKIAVVIGWITFWPQYAVWVSHNSLGWIIYAAAGLTFLVILIVQAIRTYRMIFHPYIPPAYSKEEGRLALPAWVQKNKDKRLAAAQARAAPDSAAGTATGGNTAGGGSVVSRGTGAEAGAGSTTGEGTGGTGGGGSVATGGTGGSVAAGEGGGLKKKKGEGQVQAEQNNVSGMMAFRAIAHATGAIAHDKLAGSAARGRRSISLDYLRLAKQAAQEAEAVQAERREVMKLKAMGVHDTAVAARFATLKKKSNLMLAAKKMREARAAGADNNTEEAAKAEEEAKVAVGGAFLAAFKAKKFANANAIAETGGVGATAPSEGEAEAARLAEEGAKPLVNEEGQATSLAYFDQISSLLQKNQDRVEKPKPKKPKKKPKTAKKSRGSDADGDDGEEGDEGDDSDSSEDAEEAADFGDEFGRAAGALRALAKYQIRQIRRRKMRRWCVQFRWDGPLLAVVCAISVLFMGAGVGGLIGIQVDQAYGFVGRCMMLAAAGCGLAGVLILQMMFGIFYSPWEYHDTGYPGHAGALILLKGWVFGIGVTGAYGSLLGLLLGLVAASIVATVQYGQEGGGATWGLLAFVLFMYFMFPCCVYMYCCGGKKQKAPAKASTEPPVSCLERMVGRRRYKKYFHKQRIKYLGRFIPLHRAIQMGEADLVDTLLRKGRPANQFYQGSSMLTLAIKCGHYEIVEQLLDYGAALGVPDPTGQKASSGFKIYKEHVYRIDLAPIHVACDLGRVDMVQALLDSGENPNLVSRVTHLTPLHMAVRAGHLDLVRELLMHPEIDLTVRSGGDVSIHETAKSFAARSPRIWDLIDGAWQLIEEKKAATFARLRRDLAQQRLQQQGGTASDEGIRWDIFAKLDAELIDRADGRSILSRPGSSASRPGSAVSGTPTLDQVPSVVLPSDAPSDAPPTLQPRASMGRPPRPLSSRAVPVTTAPARHRTDSQLSSASQRSRGGAVRSAGSTRSEGAPLPHTVA